MAGVRDPFLLEDISFPIDLREDISGRLVDTERTVAVPLTDGLGFAIFPNNARLPLIERL